ncbi:MAG: pyridoxal phosphate-dependent aminotransferase [Methanosarcinaceae archaeon]|nr:pyridoxal phosphate-dependent aminotransferase [Methanosarcinaceae archaeon]
MLSQKASRIPPFYVMEILERSQELERSGRTIIHLEIGEPDFPTAPHICEAAYNAMKADETKYTHSQGIQELREAVSKNYNSKFNLDLKPNQVIVTSGTSPALLLVFMGLLNPGDEVLMTNPHYACYPNFVDYMDGKAVYVHTAENGFRLEPDAVANRLDQKTKAILINSPSNPTGQLMSSKELQSLSEVVGDIPVISDEIYQGLVYEGEDHTILEYTDNAFVLNGFSKLYAMTGWRLGYLIAPPDFVRPLQKIQQNFFICANSFVQRGGIAALCGPQEYVKEMVATYDKRRRYLLQRLKEIGFVVRNEPSGAYYVLADSREFGQDSLALSRRILEEAGVAVTPGIDFGDGAEGYLRFSYANSIDKISEGMDRLREYFDR